MTYLKRIIDEKDVSQRWLAEQVGVTEVSMSRYVSGKRIPKAPIAIRMADVLGVDVKELYGWEPETHKERTETHSCDCISRQAAIDAHYEYCNKHPDAGFPVWSLKILEDLPSAQPEQTNSWCINSWCIDCKEYDTENKCCPRYNRVIKQTLDDAYRHGETEAEARYHDEIVRCKDCNHWSRESICDGFCSEDCMRHDEDFYCGYAERRTDVDANT